MKTIIKAILLSVAWTCLATAGPLDGTWINSDPNTRSIPKIRISTSPENGSRLEWWGRTHPEDTRYGPLELHLLGDSVGDHSPDKHGYATEDSGFADYIFLVTTSADDLVLECLTLFKDDSGRSNYRQRLIFKKQQ